MTTLGDLIEFQEISELKARYVRALDTQDWDLMEVCLAENAIAWFNGGKFTRHGRQAIVQFLREVITPGFVGSHIAVHPELTLTGANTAKGIWRMQEIAYFTEPSPALADMHIVGGEEMRGAGYYHEEYLKEDGSWKLSSIGVVRIFQIIERKPARADIELTVEPARGMRR
jgi:SnoaL-like domain